MAQPSRSQTLDSQLDFDPSDPPPTYESASTHEADYNPSTTPRPGQPLLYNSQLLVYPLGHSCSKCWHTGYRAYDPNNPCTTCWDVYARPYQPSLIPAPPGYELQKPLPGSPRYGVHGAHRPPQHPPPHQQPYQSSLVQSHSQPDNFHEPPQHPPPHQPSSESPSNSSEPSLPPSYTQPLAPPQGHAPHLAYRPTSTAPTPWYGYAPQSPPIQPMQQQQWNQPRVLQSWNAPTNAIAVRAGDPSLGGWLCPVCGGDGTVYGFFLESKTCSRCRGVGRVYN